MLTIGVLYNAEMSQKVFYAYNWKLQSMQVYCWGSFYIVSGDLIQPLSEATNTVPIWWISDVYLTGLIPKYLQMRQKKIQHLLLTDYIEEELYFLQKLRKYPRTTLFGVIRSSNDLHRAWSIVKAIEHLPWNIFPIRAYKIFTVRKRSLGQR